MYPTTTTASSAPPVNPNALTKLWVKFKDGNRKHFYSFDTSGRYEVADPRVYGIKGLRKRVLEKYLKNIEACELYDNATDQKLEQWVVKGQLTQDAQKWM